MKRESYFTSEFFTFFRELSKHNNREWFQEHKWRYEQFVRDPFLKFIEDFRPQLNSMSPHFIADPKPSGGSLLRIYRDMRFRKGQAPYQTMAAARFPHRAWKERTAPGFYLHLDSVHCFFACGLWHPDGDTRALVRESIMREPAKWKRASKGKPFNSVWELSGESLKRMPPGCDPKHPFATDLMRKDFTAGAYFKEAEVCSADFLNRVTKATRAAAPFMEFLTRALALPWSPEDRPAVREVLRVE
ncbi:MAG TPA: TIGR02453 family protein [Pyrinomonadaceae bacterium]|jgi:uncharacterized protein (TIGR02453 family)|nr:TIGR02453 family protein [Pyrinomonadaceae bacterium]